MCFMSLLKMYYYKNEVGTIIKMLCYIQRKREGKCFHFRVVSSDRVLNYVNRYRTVQCSFRIS